MKIIHLSNKSILVTAPLKLTANKLLKKLQQRMISLKLDLLFPQGTMKLAMLLQKKMEITKESKVCFSNVFIRRSKVKFMIIKLK